MITKDRQKGVVIKTSQRSKETRRTRGGVSPRPGVPAIRGAETISQPTGKAPTAGTFPGFVYNGGPVITCPQVYTSFWGPLWESDPAHLESAARLCQFNQDLLNSDFMNVLNQYGVGFGSGSGAFVQASFVSNVGSTLTDPGIQSIIQSCINAGALPEPTNPSNNALVIYLDETVGVEDPTDGLVLCEPTNDTAFGYHNFFLTTAGNPFYYAVIPALTDSCLNESCQGDDINCSLHLSELQEQRRTQVTSHEFAEMTSDPQLNAWFDPNYGETGDICNGESDIITVGANTWTVQRIYSKYDDIQSQGSIFCMSQTSTPEPRLSPGPAARPAVLARAKRVASHERLLPLPPIYFNATTDEVSMEERKLREYVHGVFYPLRPEHIMADFPSFLHKVATMLEKN